MGMLMYEDMKVSVLQLLLVRKVSWAVGDSSLFFSTYTDIEGAVRGQGKYLLSVEKSCVAASQEKKNKKCCGNPGEIGLEGTFPGKSISVDALFFHGVEESEIDDADDGPVYEGGY